MPPKSTTSAQMPRYDPYAWARCQCGHLLYKGEIPGCACRWCPCDDHRPAADTPEAQADRRAVLEHDAARRLTTPAVDL